MKLVLVLGLGFCILGFFFFKEIEATSRARVYGSRVLSFFFREIEADEAGTKIRVLGFLKTNSSLMHAQQWSSQNIVQTSGCP